MPISGHASIASIDPCARVRPRKAPSVRAKRNAAEHLITGIYFGFRQISGLCRRFGAIGGGTGRC